MSSIVEEVCRVWKGLPKGSQRWLVREAMRSSDAAWQMRCKIIRNLVRGESPQTIARLLGCSRSQVYRVAHRFLAEGPEGLVDRREDNGCAKVDEHFAATVLERVAGSPLEHGDERPTWTQELLILVAQRRTGVRVRVTTMSRLLARWDARRGRPKPTVGCPWPKARKTRRLKEIQQWVAARRPGQVVLYVDEVDIPLNPKIGDDGMLPGQQKEVLTPGRNVKRYLAGALNAPTGRLTWVEGPRKTSSLLVSLVDQLVQRAYRGGGSGCIGCWTTSASLAVAWWRQPAHGGALGWSFPSCRRTVRTRTAWSVCGRSCMTMSRGTLPVAPWRS